MTKLEIFRSDDAIGKDVPDWTAYNWQFLAQGDSWFSSSTLKGKRSNILENLYFPQAAAVVNCATPGDELTNMVDARRDPLFISLICGPKQQFWNALFLSGGGNDLIAALKVAPKSGDVTVTPHDRLLLTQSEWGGAFADASSPYISKEGWTVFQAHVEQQYRIIESLRTQNPTAKKIGRVIPIFTHTYDYATPRNSGAGLNIGPWLYPSLQRYGIPAGDWDTLANTFIDKLYAVIKGMENQLPDFHVVDTRGTLIRAADGSEGVSGDWENEIHATEGGYGKIGLKFVPVVASVLGMGPLATGFAAMTQRPRADADASPVASVGIAVPPELAAAATTPKDVAPSRPRGPHRPSPRR
jgi:hypothetical protein